MDSARKSPPLPVDSATKFPSPILSVSTKKYYWYLVPIITNVFYHSLKIFKNTTNL